MRIFFNNKNNEIEEKNSNAIDIITNKFTIAVRISGLEVRSRITNEILENCKIDLDFCGDGIKIEEKK
jgi:hypothetical protein